MKISNKNINTQSDICEDQLITKKDLKKVFWKSLPFEISWNYVRQDHMGFAYSMTPIVEKLYKNKEDRAEALKRHMEFFNITVYFSTLVLGIVTAMEEQKSKDPNFDTQSINNVKASLMGPLSGIGDSLFLGTLRIIAAGIGASLALNGSIFGAILFLLIYNIPAFALRYFGMMKGYEVGAGLLNQIQKSGLMNMITHSTAVLGLMTIGSMIATMVSVKVPLTFGSGDAVTKVQTILDSIMPCLLPLGVTFLIYWLLGKNIKVTYILIGVILISIVLAKFAILAP
ncbi:PTS system mannose/fructose/sorbose family transporter subunit IID [Clostridium beijerinckii]|uniref:PTS system mannose/fructose/sorbose family transporter subunit IID n=1 Tax=Clostridium beijerinckii TaxID=1520 RepID=UPI001493FCEB|nr:PTS system mannose/fructose/sorbose family transporter subunit IID [Clostridium beijerinckii]NOW05034.1 fructoselysine and glucoselysine-specific PTS system IID component [Clostridium beijerinckii]NYC01824.1 fructoselysine and glucoselysine-specific PTS system IID component [Clostridium beijerinckii]